MVQVSGTHFVYLTSVNNVTEAKLELTNYRVYDLDYEATLAAAMNSILEKVQTPTHSSMFIQDATAI